MCIHGTSLLKSQSILRRRLGHYRCYRKSHTLPTNPVKNISAASTLHFSTLSWQRWSWMSCTFPAGDGCTHVKPHQSSCQPRPRQLEQAVQSCKVTFTIWQHVDGDGRPQPGKVWLYFPQWYWQAACPPHPSIKVWHHPPRWLGCTHDTTLECECIQWLCTTFLRSMQLSKDIDR